MRPSPSRLLGLLLIFLVLSSGMLHGQWSVARQWNEQLLSAIRIDTPHPPKHARNLFHTAVAMYDAWAAYDTTAVGYIHHERATAADVPAARDEAISYAAYRVLKARFVSGPGAATTNAALDAQMATLGYDINVTTTSGTSPAAVGNRIAATILAWGLTDGSNETGGYQDPGYSNPQPPLIVLQGGSAVGGIPAGTDPNRWQPLALDAAFTQNGIPIPNQVQSYVGVTWLNTLPFSLSRSNPGDLWLDPGTPAKLGGVGDAEYKEHARELMIKSSQINSTTLIDISPGAMGNNPLGTDDGTGHPVNPVTGQPYAPNLVKLGDYARVMAEFWADGPDSETPPGHWHVLANEVADTPGFQKRIGGAGPVVDDLEWDVKTYFAVAGATHDAACACWGAKRYYEAQRPVTAIRYMCSLGQSSDQGLPSYNANGILLEDGVCELITAGTSAPGQKHEFIWDMNTRSNVLGASHIGEIAVYSWPSEPDDRATQTSAVRWMFGKDWVPYQRKNFNSPAFPGYISGHSTFSRAAAEALTAITGNEYVHGGLGTFTATADSYLVFERGPTQTVQLQWATYYDAADLAGVSRRWGGIHPSEDDYPARVIGSQVGKSVWALAKKYWDGSILTEKVVPTMVYQPGGGVVITTPTRRGLYYHIESSTDLNNWTAVTTDARTSDTSLTVSDSSPASPARFYRVVFDAKAP